MCEGLWNAGLSGSTDLSAAGGTLGCMNWFTSGGAEYARSRPDYPPEVAAFLASLAAPDADAAGRKARVVDIGCGSGQFTCRLAEVFPVVVGVDPSLDQLASAAAPASGAGGRVDYVCGEAERLPCADGSASLITAAQSAHWFDLPRFWDEVRRIAVDGAVAALVTYGTMTIEPVASGSADPLVERFDRFYRHEMAEYWPPERALIESGYAEIDFPFPEIAAPRMTIRRRWGLDDVVGYVKTWSAVRNLKDQGRDSILDRFVEELAALWEPCGAGRAVEWPVTMRVGHVT